MRTLLTIMLLCSMTACKIGPLDFRKPAFLHMKPPPGPPEWQQGYVDGCESGSDAYSNPFMKLVDAFELKQDPILRHNKMYHQVWKDAFLYCAHAWEKTNWRKL